MPVKILTVQYDAARGIFEDDYMSHFIQNKRIIQLTPQFFMVNSFGSKKVQHYGKEITTIVRSFFGTRLEAIKPGIQANKPNPAKQIPTKTKQPVEKKEAHQLANSGTD